LSGLWNGGWGDQKFSWRWFSNYCVLWCDVLKYGRKIAPSCRNMLVFYSTMKRKQQMPQKLWCLSYKNTSSHAGGYNFGIRQFENRKKMWTWETDNRYNMRMWRTESVICKISLTQLNRKYRVSVSYVNIWVAQMNSGEKLLLTTHNNSNVYSWPVTPITVQGLFKWS
jgi:hypothetical protein